VFLQTPLSARPCPDLSAPHADESLGQHSGAPIARLDPKQPDLYLAELIDGTASGRLFTLEWGELVEQQPEHLLLSEAFAPQQGWVIDSSHCSWPDGLR